MPESTEDEPLSILALDAFHGGSHRQFTQNLKRQSRHQWHLLTGKPVHWKWRMRSSPIAFAEQTRQLEDTAVSPDVLFCTDMLDLPVYLGMLGHNRIQQIPKVVYFHENQWTYPTSPRRKPDNHFGYTNLLSAISADQIWFNSQFHLDDFLQGSRKFLKQMPDTRDLHQLDRLRTKAHIIPPGFKIPDNLASEEVSAAKTGLPLTSPPDKDEITVGWVSRWEYDKCPEGFLSLLKRLQASGIRFKLILLGARPRHSVPELEEIRTTYASNILHDGFADDLEAYWELLARMDVVVSTANHEFFGIAICEAIWAGAVPVVPDRLSYRDHVPESCRYQTLDDAVELIRAAQSTETRRQKSELCKNQIESLQTRFLIKQIDSRLTQLANSFPTRAMGQTGNSTD